MKKTQTKPYKIDRCTNFQLSTKDHTTPNKKLIIVSPSHILVSDYILLVEEELKLLETSLHELVVAAAVDAAVP